MKLSLTLSAALLLQAGTVPSISNAPAPIAEPQHLRYVRALTLPPHASGIACTVLDASVYAHSASASADDLRLFRSQPHARPQEVPFVVSYSAANPTDAQAATIINLTQHDNDLTFDLDMPPRPYTQVDLQLAAQNFLASADVSGLTNSTAPAKPLGNFTLFDLTQQHLARSTSIPLQESTFPRLHIKLHVTTLDGKPLPHLAPSILQGATIPASREAQTLYTIVAATSTITQQAASSFAQLRVPAHVPIERLHLSLDRSFKADFLRPISLIAEPDPPQPGNPQEVINGQVWRVTRNAISPPISASQLNLTAVLASNLQSPATIQVHINNDVQPPLPIRAVQLEMRQRTLCFDAFPSATYALRYGDDALHTSVYDLGDLSTLPARPIAAILEPEELNPGYIRRHIVRTYDQRNPDLFWIALLAAIAVLGSLVSRRTMRQGRRR
ncbi:MAG: hypothetical protein WBY53_08775 [Acidobacteriaceae bacterium]